MTGGRCYGELERTTAQGLGAKREQTIELIEAVLTLLKTGYQGELLDNLTDRLFEAMGPCQDVHCTCQDDQSHYPCDCESCNQIRCPIHGKEPLNMVRYDSQNKGGGDTIHDPPTQE